MKKHLQHAAIIAVLLLACGARLLAGADDAPAADVKRPATFRTPAW